MNRLLLATVTIALLVLAALPFGVSAQATDPASVMSGFNAAATDPEAAVAFLADDVTIRVIPPPPGQTGVWTGKEQARAFLQFTKGQNIKREVIGNWQVVGDKVSGNVRVDNNDFAKLGVGKVEHALEAVVQGGKIKSFTSTMLPAEQQRLAAARAAQQPQTLPVTGERPNPYALGLAVMGVALVAAGVLGAKRRRAA